MRNRSVSLSTWLLLMGLLLCVGAPVWGQDRELPDNSQFKEPKSRLWINTYGNIRLSNKFFWVAQTHFRFQERDDRPFAGQIAQVYNRHAISYLFSKKFNVSLGGVLRVNFNTDEVLEKERPAVPEWRIWHEYLFAVPMHRMNFYHRIRIEHRWSKDFKEGSSYIFRNRWRYMASAKIPINKPKLGPKAFYIGPEAELIMQSGKSVINSPMEDLRLHTSFGYIIKPQLTVATGLMYSMGQELKNGDYYNQKWTIRLHVYFSPDLRKVWKRLPSVN